MAAYRDILLMSNNKDTDTLSNNADNNFGRLEALRMCVPELCRYLCHKNFNVVIHVAISGVCTWAEWYCVISTLQSYDITQLHVIY